MKSKFGKFAIDACGCTVHCEKKIGDFAFERVDHILTVKYETNLGENDSSPIYKINYYGC